ncbi:MAG TPA: histidine phosphatase family protein [Pseudonocardia sp.]|jgi:probable phosphoglycerate mutase|uniref:histidine phosphatase family protein n=1 Tax=Pseudonocardia sp. TaxID=60912 RepID=UPI002B4AD74F|nr:histidine phosphatase family protein [Pseudonocardia sp.]HLU55766.1 histidine phosphatase family protein [Pseudonocardia sp.]
MSTQLTLVRHGRTIWHGENRYAGVSDVPLDETGQAQALALAAWARQQRFDALVSSPVPRALATAAPVAAALGLETEVVSDLREVDFGIAEGRTLAELRQTHPEVVRAFVADPVANPFPGAEPPAEAAERAVRALRDIAERHNGGSVLVVAHNTLLRLALCAWLGVPLARYRAVLPRLENAAATRLRVPAEPDRPPALLALNVPTSPAVTADEPVPIAGRTA